jgi:hypothetical protein
MNLLEVRKLPFFRPSAVDWAVLVLVLVQHALNLLVSTVQYNTVFPGGREAREGPRREGILQNGATL